jgi:signal transduction histidine kinase
LLSNAVKYSPQGSPVSFELIKQADQIIIQVKDQGIGIPLEDQSRLFENFHRASNVSTTPGTGLGLSIVKKSVEVHGGNITFVSNVGAGTTFTVKIPLSVEDGTFI